VCQAAPPSDALSCADPLYAYSGTREEVAAACCSDPECASFEYSPWAGEGQLCRGRESYDPPPPFEDETNKGCFEAPLRGLTATRVSSEVFDTLDGAGKACLAEPACGAVVMEQAAGTYGLHSAEGIVDAEQAHVLYKMSRRCARFLWTCSGHGKTFVGKGNATARGIR